MKKRRLLSMLLSAAMLLPTLPFAAATSASAAVNEEVVYENIMSKTSVAPFGEGDEYIRVTDIKNKNDGVVFNVDGADLTVVVHGQVTTGDTRITASDCMAILYASVGLTAEITYAD